MTRRIPLLVALLLSIAVGSHAADTAYQKPPKEILEVLDAPAFPYAFPSPDGKAVALATPLRYPPISDLAEPLLRLAGVRVNPRNNAVHGASYYASFAVKRLPDGAEVPVQVPAGARLGSPRFNAPGTMLVFQTTTASSVELWVADVATGSARRVDGLALNPVLGWAYAWMPDQKTILVKAVAAGRGAEPKDAAAPLGPHIEESAAVKAASSTYEARDLLRTPHDADLFEHYATAQVALVDAATGKVTRVGPAGVLAKVQASPSGEYLLVERIRRPYSYTRPWNRFPTDVEVWDREGKVVESLASLPLAEQVPIHGVRTGPRGHGWRPTAPATLVWAEALDDGDTYRKVPYHDRVMLESVGGEARELTKTKQRFAGLEWIERGGRVLVVDYDNDRHWIEVTLLDADDASVAPRVVWSLSSDDRYKDPGEAVYRMLPNGAYAVMEH
ncbi:MAG TPA: S9 family peptidase, partial [Thermoanaerobaculia bacterium]